MPKWNSKNPELITLHVVLMHNRWETKKWARFPSTKGGSSPVDFATAIRCPEVASCCVSHCSLTKALRPPVELNKHQWGMLEAGMMMVMVMVAVG